MVSAALIDKLNEHERGLNAEVAASLRYICDAAHISRSKFEQAFTGITYVTWRNYLKESYTHSRSVALLGAFSWYCGVSMNCFYLGTSLKEHLGISDEGLKLLTTMSRLNSQDFDTSCQAAFGLLDEEIKEQLSESYFKARYMHKQIAGECDFKAPLDVKAFTQDYRQSCAYGVQTLQARLGYSDRDMGKVLGVSEHRYQRFRDPEDTLPIPATVAVRLKIGFQLEDTSFMLENMVRYPEYRSLRHYQEVRDSMMRPILMGLSEENIWRLSQALKILFIDR